MRYTNFVSASVRSRTLEDRVVELTYCGLLTDAAYSVLVGDVIRQISDAPSAVIRYDKAMVVMALDREVPPHVANTPPAAIIVLPEQMEFWRRYSRKLADLGLMRAVFLPSEAQAAYRWASVMAANHRSQ